MNEKPMTTEECRRYSAEEILGWDTMMSGYGSYRDDGYYDALDEHIHIDDRRDWKPDEDRNQLWLVMQRVPEIDEVLECLTSEGSIVGSFGTYSEDDMRHFYKFAWEHPEEALKAICEAHKRHQ